MNKDLNGKKKFDTKVQYLKYKVLREVARHAYNDTLQGSFNDIAKQIVKDKATMRCCIYKERAIVNERIGLASGGHKDIDNIIEVLDIACDECPMDGYEVTHMCRGCLAHRCEDVCKRDAITFDENQKAHIDKEKCVNCGMCAKVCPYSAIMNFERPCVKACKVKAISMNSDHAAQIDISKCINCGACVYQCPWGAITDKSYIIEVVNMIKERGTEKRDEEKLYAVIAPSISGQFTYTNITLGQVVSGIKELGFDEVVEAALGADVVAYYEAKELAETGFLTSSCCPAFVDFVKKNFPKLKDNISHNPSPMVAISMLIKEKDPKGKVVFIGPCTAKKAEIRLKENKEYVDSALTFEELQAFFDARKVDLESLPESKFDSDSLGSPSPFGRIFARCGGLAEAVAEALKEQGEEDFELNAVSCDGIEECRTALLKASRGIGNVNFIEGMACVGGCIGGAGCLTHGPRNKIEVDKFSKQSDISIEDAINKL